MILKFWQVVDHKMGAEHAKLTEQSFAVALDSLQTVHNIKSLGVKKLAKRVARETGKGAGGFLHRCRGSKLKCTVMSWAQSKMIAAAENAVEMKAITHK